MKKKDESSQFYSEEFKNEVVFEILSGQINAGAARKKYQIGGKMTIYRWLKQKNVLTDRQISVISSGMKSDKKEKLQQDSTQIQEVDKLKAELKRALLQAEAYKILVRTAKEKYGLDLEKKHGAKQ
jgi:transposase-like protein